MATYYDGLNYAYKLFEENPPASSAQLVYLYLLHLNNRNGNSGTVVISDRELGFRTRLAKSTITEAKRTLKNLGLIDFKVDRDTPGRKTTYRLLFFTEQGQEAGHKVGQTPGQEAGHQKPCSCIPARREEEEKEEEKEKPEGTRERDIFKIWLDEMHRPLGASERYELTELEELHGYEKVRNAIIATRQSRAYPTFADLKNLLKGVNNGTSKQSVSKQSVERSHEESATVPWEDR